MTVEVINGLFLTGAVLLVISVLFSQLSSRLGVPILLMFLFVGMLAGEDGLGQIEFDNYSATYLVSNLALAIILLDGGLRTRVASFKLAFWPSLSLATVGVFITTLLTGLLATWLFNLTFLQGLLVGAIVGSTDAAAVFSLLKGRAINERVGATLEIESGTNDPMAVFLTVTLIAILASTGEQLGVGFVALSFVLQFGIGIALGLGGGWLALQLINRIQLPEGLYPILVAGLGISLFALSNTLGGSGILSIYLFGLLLGNMPTRSRHSILNVMDGLTWLSQIVMFVFLGLLVTPHELSIVALPALALAFGMILFARPIAVWLSLLPFRQYNKRERGFLSWVGLRGAVPIILAVFPLMAGLDNAQLYFNIAFFVVMVSLVVQGASLTYAAKLAEVELPPLPEPVSRAGVEIFPTSDWELYVYRLKAEKWCIGEPLRKLAMPEGTRIAALFRNRTLLHPSGSTVLEEGDTLCVLGQEKALPELSELFSTAPESDVQPRFFGDFFFALDVKLLDVAAHYGLTLPDEYQQATLQQLVDENLSEKVVLGDHFRWQGVEFVVSEVEDYRALQLGLCLPDEDEDNE